jgi:hypothetical protein
LVTPVVGCLGTGQESGRADLQQRIGNGKGPPEADVHFPHDKWRGAFEIYIEKARNLSRSNEQLKAGCRRFAPKPFARNV